ncbi:hypothetical protein E4U55_007127 [Claviceps digitariae]|nr:hypothetical protein E4U55_007127 [Claviceps digitariae]
MQFSTSAALAAVAVFAGQTLALLAFDCIDGTSLGETLSYTPCRPIAPATWQCIDQSVVTHMNSQYYVHAAPGGSNVAWSCPPSTESDVLMCVGNGLGTFAEDCPIDKVRISTFVIV